MQPRQSKLFSPRLYQKWVVDLGSEFRSATPGHVLLDDIVSHKYMYQASFINLILTEEKLPVATPTITFMQVVIDRRAAKSQVRRVGPRVWFEWWKVLTAELRCLWVVRLHLLDRNGGRTKCASKLLSLVIDLLMASKNVAFELSVNLPTVGTSDESKCEP